ncbi:MAG: hypothetical protein ACR2PO_19185 [Methyloligellaceae bacterium]
MISGSGKRDKDRLAQKELQAMLESLYGHIKMARRLELEGVAYFLDMTVLAVLEHADAETQAAFLRKFKKSRR